MSEKVFHGMPSPGPPRALPPGTILTFGASKVERVGDNIILQISAEAATPTGAIQMVLLPPVSFSPEDTARLCAALLYKAMIDTGVVAKPAEEAPRIIPVTALPGLKP